MARIVTENAGLIFSIITCIVFCSAAFGVAQNQINHNREAINEFQDDHDILIEVQSDVRWIRSTIKRMDEKE
tara:strand:+ start:59 stop:274 length:216 start_codon:yes stop_codon:yes gene_type:complete